MEKKKEEARVDNYGLNQELIENYFSDIIFGYGLSLWANKVDMQLAD